METRTSQGSSRAADSGVGPALLFFVAAPLMVAIVETFLQYSVLPQGDLMVSLAFAILFTIPGTFFAWLTTTLVARLPGADRLPLIVVLAFGFVASLLIFRPYNVFVYEWVSRATPQLQAMTATQGDGHVPQSVARFLFVNVPGLFVWIAINLFFATRFGFPAYRLASVTSVPTTAPDVASDVPPELPEFCRAAGIADLADLWAVSAEEHYLRLHGAFGTRVIRQPFGAAIAQLPKARGLQVHRSHWVAFGRVARIDAARNIQIILVDGTQIPVSSSYWHAVRLTETSLLSG